MWHDLGLLVLRLVAGGMMVFGHGWPKLANFSEKMGQFADPIRLGSEVSFSLAVFAEFFCATAIILGLLTRFASIPLIITMGVAGFIHHVDDPWAKKELSLLYFGCFLVLLLTGAGKFSLDHALKIGRR